MSEKKIPLPKEITSGQFVTKEQSALIHNTGRNLFIGIPKETAFQEKRVALVPDSVRSLTGQGHRIVIEQGAGVGANYTDHLFSEAAGEIAHSHEQVFDSQILLKVAPISNSELDLLRPDQVVISPLHLPTLNDGYIQKLVKKRIVALAWEYIQDADGSYPFVRVLSELAGIRTIQIAAGLLSGSDGGSGILLGGISGVAPAKVVILGAGIVAEYAARAAIGMGAEVRIFDDNVYKLMRVKHNLNQSIFTSTMNPAILEKELLDCDVAIGAIHSEDGRSPVIVSDQMVAKMKAGSVIMDVSIDQGGCFATSRLTTHHKPTFVEYDVIHYCVPNLPSAVPRTASMAISNVLTPILQKIQEMGTIDGLLYNSPGLRHGVYTYKGCLTNAHLGRKFKMKSTNLDLLLTSNI